MSTKIAFCPNCNRLKRVDCIAFDNGDLTIYRFVCTACRACLLELVSTNDLDLEEREGKEE